jgi:L-rhamnose isomerase
MSSQSAAKEKFKFVKYLWQDTAADQLSGVDRLVYRSNKLEDCGTIFKLVRSTPTVSLHIPWDKPDDAAKLRDFANARGLSFDARNSNTFQDQPGQKHSYKFGSLTHPDKAVRQQQSRITSNALRSARRSVRKRTPFGLAMAETFPGSNTSAARSNVTSKVCATFMRPSLETGACSSSTSFTNPHSTRR